ncbi:MAG TPA: DMT family transporter [Acidimicrobiia bacterium]
MPASVDRLDPSRRSRSGAWLAAASAVAFASLAVFGREASAAGMRAETLLQWRFGVAAAVLAAAGMLRHPIPARLRLLLLGSGLIYTAQTSFYFAALGRITAGTTALLLYLAPVFVVVYARLLGRRPSRLQMLAVAIGLSGLAVIAGLPSRADADPLGLTAGAAAGATFAGYILAGEFVFARVPPLVTAAHTMVGAAVGFLAVDVARGGVVVLPAGAEQWWIVTGTVIFPTLVAIPMLFAAVSRIGAGPTAIISNAEPVATIILAAIFLSEPARPVQVLGGALILTAASLAQRSAMTARPGRSRV